MDEEKKDIIEEGTPIKNVKTPFGLPIPTLVIIGVVAIAIILAIVIGIMSNNDNNSSDLVDCLSCGDSFDETMNFCPNCGAKKETSNSDNKGNSNDTETGLKVNSSKEFLNAIGDNTKIILSDGTYNLYGLTGINNSKVEKDSSEFATDGYVISDVSNLEITGEGTLITLSGNDIWATGLNFTNCKNITISNIDFTTLNNCDSDWTQLLLFNNCENITIKNCTFNNCDTPIYFASSKSIIVEKVEIKNTYAMYSEFSSVTFKDLKSSNFEFLCTSSESTLIFNNCKISDGGGAVWSLLIDDALHWTGESKDSIVEFSNCTIENNDLDAFFAKTTGYEIDYTHSSIKFKNCTFSNNNYYNGDLNSSNYINCSFYNNTQLTNWTEETIQEVIQIHDVYVDDIDSADGVDMRISWTNTSDKTIKYVHFYVVPYNAVGDPMYCEIRDYSRFDAYVTGPCEPGYEGYYKIGDIYYGNLWEDVWYNGSISTIELVGIKIIYMDGSVIDIAEKDVYKTFVEFSPLKEGYGIDEAFMEYYTSEGNHRFFWSLDYLGVSVRPNVNIDVRIVNSNNDEVFYGEYYAKSENFTEINISGINKWMIATSVYDNEITPGDSSTGTFYYHIWSDDGTIDLGWLSIEINNLPTN